MPTIHPREQMCRKAENELCEAIHNISLKYDDLTTAEWLRILTAAYSNSVQSVCKYAIREERHGDANKPGGLT